MLLGEDLLVTCDAIVRVVADEVLQPAAAYTQFFRHLLHGAQEARPRPCRRIRHLGRSLLQQVGGGVGHPYQPMSRSSCSCAS